MREEFIKEVSTKIGTEIFARVAVFTKDIWRVEFEALSNIEIPQNAIDVMVLEGIHFAIYYLQQRSKGIFDNREKKQFIKKLKNCVIWCLSNIYFESPFKKDDPEKHMKGIEKIFNDFFNRRMKAYSAFKEGNITQLYKNYILTNFNNGNYKIKFAENTLTNRLKNIFSSDAILDEEIINHYVKSVVNSIFEINIQKIINEENLMNY